MPRRGRRSGMRFIEDDRDRSLTFFKRRSGLFKAASDLSTLTGARVAMVLESENERFSSFGTPDAIPIIDSFLSGDMPTESNTSEEQKIEVTNFQNEVFQLEKYKAVAEKRKKESTVRIKDIQESSRVGKYAYGKDEDLDATELYEMLCKLSRVKQVIDGRFPTLLHHNHVDVGGQLRDPSLLQPTWWRSMPSQVVTTPNYSPLSSSLPSFQHHQWSSSSSHQVLGRSGSMLPNSAMLPSQQIQPKLQQHLMGPCGPSFMQNQAPPPKEYSPHNYHMHEIDINGNNSSPFSMSPILPSPGAQQSPLQNPPTNGSSPLSVSPQLSYPLHLDYQQLSFNTENCESMHLPQNYANVGSTTFRSDSSLGLNIDLENSSANRGQNGSGHNLQGLPMAIQGNKWEGLMIESSTARERSPGGDTRSNLDELNFPWY
ncbi:unnamed protein product [Urochloa decumbens]|uniref:MADS-box domain-containing protein n=1 Tax=Urochloa decumbens TaxID=240449 RepID=A0ABC8YRW0_9POAL